MIFEEKEKNYTRLVESAAKKLGKVFIPESGEGHDLETDTLYLEDISGQLFPEGTPKEQQKLDKWYCFAEWKIEGNDVIINFVKYQ